MSITNQTEDPGFAPDPSTAAAAGSASRTRATWSGLLRLGLVAVPVKGYPAVSSSPEVHFNQLHANCGQRIRYEKHCPEHGRVESTAIVSGYPIAPGRYVIVNEAELEKLRPAKDKALTLERFLDAGNIDPALLSGRSLYLTPDGPAAHRPYIVLAQALAQRQKWVLGQVVLAGRRHLALVRPAERVLVVHLLHYPTQLRSLQTVEAQFPAISASDAELELAGQLVDAASQKAICWSEYQDDTAARLRALVESAAAPQVVSPVAEAPPVLSLLDALQQSVAQAATSTTETAAPRGRKEKKARRSA
jgi:DNA end-binding protein Ku